MWIFIDNTYYNSLCGNNATKAQWLTFFKISKINLSTVSKKALYSFEYNQKAKIKRGAQQGDLIVYPYMKATLYLSYVPVKNNLDSLLTDAYKLPSKHISKANDIPERLFINPEQRVYGTLFKVVGNAASQLQFFLTDSIHHFMIGSLYFYSRPNYDSLLPALDYIEKDVIHLMETLEWKEKN